MIVSKGLHAIQLCFAGSDNNKKIVNLAGFLKALLRTPVGDKIDKTA